MLDNPDIILDRVLLLFDFSEDSLSLFLALLNLLVKESQNMGLVGGLSSEIDHVSLSNQLGDGFSKLSGSLGQHTEFSSSDLLELGDFDLQLSGNFCLLGVNDLLDGNDLSCTLVIGLIPSISLGVVVGLCLPESVKSSVQSLDLLLECRIHGLDLSVFLFEESLYVVSSLLHGGEHILHLLEFNGKLVFLLLHAVLDGNPIGDLFLGIMDQLLDLSLHDLQMVGILRSRNRVHFPNVFSSGFRHLVPVSLPEESLLESIDRFFESRLQEVDFASTRRLTRLAGHEGVISVYLLLNGANSGLVALDVGVALSDQSVL